jgi:predicted nucleic acid-binding protein
MRILLDTSFLLALAAPKDKNNPAARATLRDIYQDDPIIVAPVQSELFYMVRTRVGYAQAVRNFASAQAAFHIEPLTGGDMIRMREIMTQYQDAELDFVDVAIMAVAERLNVTRICTFDRRDFSIFRPTHCPYLELLPK